MKVMAYYPVHYGAEYFNASIKSIDEQVDKILILYTPKPSYGHGTEKQCPETEDELKEIAFRSSDKIEWVTVDAGNEGNHRSLAFTNASEYDIMLTLDTDEVWEPTSLERCIQEAYDGEAWRRNISGFIHFWKSFNWACQDGFEPARIFNLKRKNNLEVPINGTIYHFGYAQSKKIMDYKFDIHGHKNELKEGWLENTYYGWEPGKLDLHPTCGVWPEAKLFDKNTLPDILKSHPNFNKEIIS
jgi:glycosyltransferase involved in cell wall biosynthesis